MHVVYVCREDSCYLLPSNLWSQKVENSITVFEISQYFTVHNSTTSNECQPLHQGVQATTALQARALIKH